MDKGLVTAKTLVSPIVKLLDMVGNAIGTAYEPRHKRKMADASAYEISVVSEAIRNAADIPIDYNKNDVAMNSEDFNRLLQRTKKRFLFQEITKQSNIENIVDNAYEILESEENCTEEPIEQGWMNRFFDSVADVSDEDLQKLWGKILAGETVNPKACSLRTLDTLKNLSKYEANLFLNLTPFIIRMGETFCLASNQGLLEKYGVTFGEIMMLDECGLINSNGLVSLNCSLSNSCCRSFFNKSKIAIIQGLKYSQEQLVFGVYSLTKAGIELYNILDCTSSDDFFRDFVEKVWEKNSSTIKISVHEVKTVMHDKVEYQNNVLYELPSDKEAVNNSRIIGGKTNDQL